MNIDKPLAKNTHTGILRVSGEPFSMGSATEVIVKHRNAAMVHTDLNIVLSSTVFVSWGMCSVWPAKPHSTQSFAENTVGTLSVLTSGYNHHSSLFKPSIQAGPPMVASQAR